ncbi:MAG TPA: BBE domain-containing protein [Roseiarcus sp.]|nr:BBE domain-containing protein [Roseiarcus sp.]
MRFYAAFSTSAPDEVSLDAALITTPSGERRFAVSVCYVGAFEDGEPVIEPLTRLRSVVEDRIVPRSYLQIQSANDSVFPRGRRYYWKAQFLRELTDAAIDMLLETYRSAPGGSFIVLQHVGGAISRVPNTATAYFNRDALYDCFPVMIWDDPADDAINIRWARRFWSAMQPFSTGGVYANNLGEEGEDRVQAAYGENYSRLSELKNKYDPGNIFNSNQNIRPR